MRLLNQFGFPTPDQRRFRADTGRVLDLEASVKKASTREAFLADQDAD